MKVLDLGCGDGTTALPAAQARRRRARRRHREQPRRGREPRAQERRPDELPVPGRRRLPTCDDLARRPLRPRRQHLRGDVRAEAVRRGQGDGARDAARRPDRHGQLDPERSDAGRADPEDQLRLLAAAAGGLRQPDDVGRRGQRDRAIRGRRAFPTRTISFERDTYTFNFPGTPRGVRRRVPDLLRADDERVRGRAADGARPSCRTELEALFDDQNTSRAPTPPRFRRRSCASPSGCERPTVRRSEAKEKPAEAGEDELEYLTRVHARSAGPGPVRAVAPRAALVHMWHGGSDARSRSGARARSGFRSPRRRIARR